MGCHFTRSLMQIRIDTCECHLCNRPHLPFQVCTSTRSGEETAESFRHHEITERGSSETNGRYFWTKPIFSRPTHNCPFLGGKCMRRDPARPPSLRTRPATLPIDKVARFCQKRRYGEEGGALRPPPFFNQLIYGVSDDDRD